MRQFLQSDFVVGDMVLCYMTLDYWLRILDRYRDNFRSVWCTPFAFYGRRIHWLYASYEE